jgi:hypothetical protein
VYVGLWIVLLGLVGVGVLLYYLVQRLFELEEDCDV